MTLRTLYLQEIIRRHIVFPFLIEQSFLSSSICYRIWCCISQIFLEVK